MMAAMGTLVFLTTLWLLVVVGAGLGVGLAELIDLGVRIAARSIVASEELDDVPAPARR